MAELQSKRQLILPTTERLRNTERNDCDNLDLIQLSRMYKLTRICKLHDDFDERLSLSRSKIQNNEELLLIFSSDQSYHTIETNLVTHLTKDLQSNEFDSDNDDDQPPDTEQINYFVPTQQDIDQVTQHINGKHLNGPNVVNIDELVLQSDVQYDIRKILISLANTCAYVIGAGSYAPKIITMLKQRLIQRKRYEHDTQECLISMGFTRPKVQHALHINK